eukprot:3677257-Rhodomonas_salina.3
MECGKRFRSHAFLVMCQGGGRGGTEKMAALSLSRPRTRRRLLASTLSLLALSVLCLSLLPVVAAGEPEAVSSETGAAEDVPEPAPAVAEPAPEPVKDAPAETKEGTDAPPAELPQSSEEAVDMTMVSGVIATVVIGLIGACYLFGGEKRRVFKGDAVFLLGECDSGKTVSCPFLRRRNLLRIELR